MSQRADGQIRTLPTDEIAELTRQLRFVEGQMQMLMGFLLAVIGNHPTPMELARHFEDAVQTTLAKSESTPIAEEHVEGAVDVSRRLGNALEAARLRSKV